MSSQIEISSSVPSVRRPPTLEAANILSRASARSFTTVGLGRLRLFHHAPPERKEKPKANVIRTRSTELVTDLAPTAFSFTPTYKETVRRVKPTAMTKRCLCALSLSSIRIYLASRRGRATRYPPTTSIAMQGIGTQSQNRLSWTVRSSRLEAIKKNHKKTSDIRKELSALEIETSRARRSSEVMARCPDVFSDP